MRWQAAAALAAAAFAAGGFAAAASRRRFPCAPGPPARAARSRLGPLTGDQGARRDGEEHGSSRWATRKDIAPFGDPKDPDNNIILTDNARIRLVSRRFDLSTDTNDNVLVVGGPGTGKTRYYVKPNLLQANASFFVTDPKGTLIREMGGALAELGYEIRAFDTIDFTRSMRFNPHSLHTRRGGRHPLRPRHRRQHRGRGRPQRRPLLEEKAERLVYTALTAYLVMHCEPADRNLDGLLTLLSLADARDDPGYMSPLDMVFRELETRQRYVRRGGASAEGGSLRGFSEEDGAWSGSRSASPRRLTTSRSRATASSAWPPATP
ncbi:MAG: type IV secretory system conjugative DNA transfer family protein [Collinsella sp.]